MSCTAESSLYYHQCILAPMVRVCELGFRELCQRSGADVVFTEEVVAARLKGCRREVVSYTVGPLEGHDAQLGGSSNNSGINSSSSSSSPHVATHTEEVVEFVSYEPYKKQFKRTVALALRRHDRTAPLVLQLGVADGEFGAAAVRVCCEDVDGVDLNMGCPKHFSITNGFGAALMRKPEVAGAILKAVHAAAASPECVQRRGGKPLPLSLKTRLMETAEATVAMLESMLTHAGHTPGTPVVHAITLHAREREQRSGLAPHYDRAAAVVAQCRALPRFQGVCFVLNGSVLSRADAEAKCEHYGFDGSMLARSAMQNPTVFAPRTASPDATVSPSAEMYMKVLGQAMRYAVYYHTLFQNFKYVLTRVFPDVPVLTPKMEAVQLKLRSYADCFAFFDIPEEERAILLRCVPSMVLVASVPELDATHTPLGAPDSPPTTPGVKRHRSRSP